MNKMDLGLNEVAQTIYIFTTIVRDNLENNKPTFCAFIDVQKAFDRVDRQLLLHKLEKIGITGRLFNVIRKIYENPTAKVEITHNISTPWFSTPVGVRQGDTTSPTLFNIFINDSIGVLKQGSQDLLDCMYSWCRKWRLSRPVRL